MGGCGIKTGPIPGITAAYPDRNVGASGGGSCKTTGRCDTKKFTQDVNAAGLCGHNDSRTPNTQELSGIINYSGYNPILMPVIFRTQ